VTFFDMRSENVIFVIFEKPSVWLLFRAIWTFLTPNYEKNRTASGHPKFTQGVHFGRFSVVLAVSVPIPIGGNEAIWGSKVGPKMVRSFIGQVVGNDVTWAILGRSTRKQ